MNKLFSLFMLLSITASAQLSYKVYRIEGLLRTHIEDNWDNSPKVIEPDNFFLFISGDTIFLEDNGQKIDTIFITQRTNDNRKIDGMDCNLYRAMSYNEYLKQSESVSIYFCTSARPILTIWIFERDYTLTRYFCDPPRIK